MLPAPLHAVSPRHGGLPLAPGYDGETLPPLYARPRHAAPRDTTKIRAALVPAVLVASTGSALGGLAAGASADDGVVRATAASSEVATTTVDVEALLKERQLVVEQNEARASRDRALAEKKAAEAAAAAEAARIAAEQEAARVAAEQAAAAKAAAEAEAAANAKKFARPGQGRITSTFGSRWGRLHAGIDMACGTGCPIRAAAAGTVISAGWEGGYGKAVRIQHADGTVTLYAHNSSILVSKGQRVAAGQQISREGSTGNSTGPHLHFEVRVGGNPVNPLVWLRQRGIS